MSEHSGPADLERGSKVAALSHHSDRFSVSSVIETVGTDTAPLRLRKLRTDGRGSFAELTQDIDRPSDVLLQIEGRRAFGIGGSTENGVQFEVYDADALRELGEVLIALSEHADDVGLLRALRARPIRR